MPGLDALLHAIELANAAQLDELEAVERSLRHGGRMKVLEAIKQRREALEGR